MVSGLTLNDQRLIFQDAEKHLASADEQQFKSALSKLKNYPLYSFLEYRWLKKNLEHTDAIQSFLKQNGKTPYAGPLKKKWLIHLAETQQWRLFNKYYKLGKNSKLQCYYYLDLYRRGQVKKAIKGAKKLWLVGFSQPKVCDELFAIFAKSGGLTENVKWQRFILAIEKRNLSLAKYLKKSLTKKQQRIANLWLKVYQDPKQIRQAKSWPVKKSQQNKIFAFGMRRLIRKTPELALSLWQQKDKIPVLNQKQQLIINKRIGLALAYRKDKQAFKLLNKLDYKGEKVRSWMIRAALSNQDWQAVNNALGQLTDKEKQQERWQYWQGRALLKLGDSKKGLSLFGNLAKNRSYYGFLAANYLQKNLNIGDSPILTNQALIEQFKQRPDFRAVKEFIFFDRDTDAKRQWWHIVRRLKKPEILVASKTAEQQGWHNLAIFTVAKAKHWDDVKLRFPLIYTKQIETVAKRQSLASSIIYGLIRRESAFDKYAQSPVGARGLMQIMPATGKEIARDLKEKWKTKAVLFEPEINLNYGAFYYKKLLQRFNHFALAAAAYNAGPHRVKRWLPSQKSLAADIWIETIPFTETREYVAAVLAYSLIYQQQLGENTLNIDDIMKDINPT